jgi:hypothetical protein
MLSNLPVTLLMTGGSVEVLIEEMQETDESGVRFLSLVKLLLAQTSAPA